MNRVKKKKEIIMKLEEDTLYSACKCGTISGHFKNAQEKK